MASQQYSYRVEGLTRAISDKEIREPFVNCVALYTTLGKIDSATIDGFQVVRIDGPLADPSHGFRITGDGPATVADMLVGEYDHALTIDLTFSEIEAYKFPTTVEVILTDEDGKTFKWHQSIVEEPG